MIPCIIIDDERAVADLIRFFIEEDRLLLSISQIAYDGRKGETVLKTPEPHLVFVDIQMPHFSGLKLMENFLITGIL